MYVYIYIHKLDDLLLGFSHTPGALHPCIMVLLYLFCQSDDTKHDTDSTVAVLAGCQPNTTPISHATKWMDKLLFVESMFSKT